MSLSALLGFDLLLLLAALADVRSYRIPNAIPAVLALGALALAFPTSAGEALSRAGAFAAMVAITGALWLRGLLGGGDMKLLAACALWIPLSQMPLFALAFGLASAIQGLTALGWTRLATRAPMAHALRARIPYGVSIAAAGIIWSAWQVFDHAALIRIPPG